MLFAVLGICLAVACLAYSLLNRPAPVTDRRLAMLPGVRSQSMATGRTGTAGDEQPSRRSVMEAKLRQLLPTRSRERLERLLIASGMTATPETVLTIWAAVAAGLPGLYLFSTVNSGQGISGQDLLVTGLIAVFGMYAPYALIRSRGGRRRHKLLRALPDTMDLMVTCVEAGLGIDAALARVVGKAKEPLAGEIRLVLHTMSMGRTRRESLELLATRTGLPELTSFASAVIQAEQMGVSLGQVMRVQAEALRTQRKQRAEQAAYKAPVKIIVVLALFIFPSMFVVILGPAVIQALSGGLK